MSKIFTADFQNLSEIISHIRKGIIDLGFDDETVSTAHIVCDEFITNIIKNAYPDKYPDTHCIKGLSYKKPIKISYSKIKNQLFIKLIDWGVSFNPLKHYDDFEGDQTHGGVGIYIAVNFVNSISYCRENQKNISTFLLKC